MSGIDDPTLAPERFRGYLRALARRSLGRHAWSKVDPSDLVQQTLLDALRVGGQHPARCEAEMAGWLRRLLACNLADAHRALGRARRDSSREVSLEQAGGEAGGRMEVQLAADQSTPSRNLQRQESAARIADILAGLPEANRRAVAMRYLEGRSIAEIADELGRSPAAVAGLLKRGLAELRLRILAEDQPTQRSEIR
jgi:RNA polymerase sigma-70 factor, ECF subfamily